MVIIERDSSLERLRYLMESAKEGRGHLVAIVGPAGVGKSTLAAAAQTVADPEGRVLWGACDDFAIAEPLGAVNDLARQVKWDMQSVLRRDGRLAAFSEAFSLFNNTATYNLIVIEDIQWADGATLDFIRYMGRRIRSSKILLLITARNDDTKSLSKLRHALADIPADRAERIEVLPFSESGVIQLAEAQALDGREIHRITGGNAFFVTELLRETKNSMPASVRDAVLTRASYLPSNGRDALNAVSIFPAGVGLAIVESVLKAGAILALDICIDYGLLRCMDGQYAFQHEIARQVIEQALPISRRRVLNTEALKALRCVENAPLAQLVHHAREANDIAAVCELAPLAAEQAASVSAHREAVRHYEAALTHASSLDANVRADLYERYAFECHLIGEIARAIVAQKSALALRISSGDRAKEGDGRRWLSRLSYLAGNRIDADQFGQEALSLLEPLGPSPELAMAYSNLSHLAMLASDVESASAFGNRALQMSEPLICDRPDILCHALNNVGSAIHWHDADSGRSYLARSLEIALANGFQDHAARTFTNRSWLELNQFPNRHAARFLADGISYCTEHDLDTWRDFMRGYLTEFLIQRGRWDEAQRIACSVVEGKTASALARYPSVIAFARIRTRRGIDAEDLLNEASQFLDAGMELQRLVPYASLMAERAWLGLGDRQAASTLLEKAQSMAPDPVYISEVLFWKYMLDGDVGLTATQGLAPPLRMLVTGEWQEAATVWQAADFPYESALALLAGDVDALYRALEIFGRLGADPVAEQIRDLIRRRSGRVAPRGPRASTKANAAGLTRREMDVLRLVELGKSNKEIGNLLFVTAKTVDHHISAILSKLNAKSRGQAAALARTAGLYDQ
ncbi:ATP-binding protein [Bosea sp. PAMC 26642]|uniref:ATP-binding protein n=1 Tax=Bosea sp. (strain PAMC 26642) TaxID=1792307 RepID=UPI00077052FC|nr:AAA family ATPase [Bosea sp. PAMC 26642]AMJ62295.1 LuxR family transcriptional regulator [Bosea sp. PAMC 26642]